MKHKSNILMVLLLFSLALVLMGMVSASDDVNETISTTNSSDVVDLSTTVEDVSESDDGSECSESNVGSDNILGSTNENEVLTDSIVEVNNFNELNTAVSDSSVSEININNDILVDNVLNLNRPITINGNNHILRTNGTEFHLFTITSDVVLKNITIRDFNWIGHNGGAIGLDGGSLTIYNSKFINNHATLAGGAIFNSAGILNIYDSIFEDNAADTMGGAIYYAPTTHSVNIFNCNFINCTANTHGGVIYSNSNLNVSSCSFINNSGRNGGSIYITGNLNVDRCNFEGDGTTLNADDSAAIHAQYGNLQSITYSNFYNLKSNSCIIRFSENNDYSTLNHCNFTSSVVNTLILRGYNGLILNDCIISDNIAKNYLVYTDNMIQTSNSLFINNFINSSDAVSAYCILLDAAYMNVSNCGFVNNSALCSIPLLNPNAFSLNASNNWWGSNSPSNSIGSVLKAHLDFIDFTRECPELPIISILFSCTSFKKKFINNV